MDHEPWTILAPRGRGWYVVRGSCSIRMKFHRFIGPFDLNADRLLLRDPGLIHQMRTVLKLRVGEKVVLADGTGSEALASISDLDPSGIEAKIVERRPSAEPKRKVALYCAVLKNENLEYAVEKAVEAGVAKIVPLITLRTVKLGLNLDRLRKIAKEAAEQSGRGIVPEIATPVRFKQALKEAAANDANYFFDVGGEDFSRAKPLTASAGVWIGPEGGWDESEKNAAKESGFAVVSLGALVLRAETAATVAVYLATR